MAKPKDKPKSIHHIGIAIPDGTDRDGVSLLKAALLCTAEDTLRVNVKGWRILKHETDFILRTPQKDIEDVEGIEDTGFLDIPKYAMLEGHIAYEYDAEPAPNIPKIDEGAEI